MTSPLYSLDILRLAAGTGDFPRLDDAQATAERQSKACGSRIVVDVRLDDDGRVVGYGHDVHACAVGQAAATLVARTALGRNLDDLVTLAQQMRAFVTFGGKASTQPNLDGIDALIPVRAYPARHAAALLAIEAAVAAATAAAA